MTEAEQQRIIGELVSDLAAAKRRLACLETKAEKLADNLGLLANWLRGHFPTGVSLSEDLSVADARSLVSEIKETKTHIVRLEERRTQFGV